jgi:hypothetical protein
MNFFGTMALHMIVFYFILLFGVFPVSEHLCFQYYFGLITTMVYCFGIISMQLDRFVAIFWDVHYKAHVTNSRAMKLCGLNVMIATTMGIASRFHNKEYAKCTNHPSLINTRKTNIFLNGIPKILAVIVTIAVSIYVVWKTKKLNKSIHPAPQGTSQPRPNEVQADTQRIDDQPNVFYRMKHHSREPSSELGTSQQNAITVEDETVVCLNQTEFFKMLKTTKTMTLLTLILVVGFLPSVILGMVHHNCSVDTGDCENFIFLVNKFSPIRLVGLLVLYMVVLKRLNKEEQ